MPAADFQSYKTAFQELSSSTKFDNFVQASQDAVNAIDNAKVSVGAAIAQSKIAFDAWQTYSPSWTSSGTAPALQNGTLTGRYMQIGKLVTVQIKLTFGSSTTYGTGNYSLTVPVNASASAGQYTPVGNASGSHSGLYNGFVVLNGTTTIQLYTPAAPGAIWGQTAPATWVSGDFIYAGLTYEAA